MTPVQYAANSTFYTHAAKSVVGKKTAKNIMLWLGSTRHVFYGVSGEGMYFSLVLCYYAAGFAVWTAAQYLSTGTYASLPAN
jgi:hypothetical protein